MQRLLEQTSARAIRYLAEIQERAVAPSKQAIEALSALVEDLPADGSPPEAVVELLDRYGSPATLGIAGPRFFGHGVWEYPRGGTRGQCLGLG